MRDFEGANEHSWWALTISARALASELGHRTNYWSRSLSTFGEFNPSIKIDQKFEQKLVIFSSKQVSSKQQTNNRFPEISDHFMAKNDDQFIGQFKTLVRKWQWSKFNLRTMHLAATFVCTALIYSFLGFKKHGLLARRRHSTLWAIQLTLSWICEHRALLFFQKCDITEIIARNGWAKRGFTRQTMIC